MQVAYVELTGERGEAGLAVDGGQDVQCELLGAFDDDVFASGIPADHVVVLWPLEEAGCMRAKKAVRMWRGGQGSEETYA